MSRIGKKPILIPEGVEVKINNHDILVKGKKGELNKKIHPDMSAKISDHQIIVQNLKTTKFHRALHGLTRTLIANMIEGVTSGFEKVLEITGVGYKVLKQGEKLVFQLGFAHPVELGPFDKDIQAEVEGTNKIIIRGIDKEKVGRIAAIIRDLKTVEPYKGKGIKYKDEYVRRKAGKAGKSVTGGK